MDLYYKQEVSVGFLVLAAAVVFVLGLMWLSGVPLGGSTDVVVPVVFENAGGLDDGDPVYVSGLKIGRVRNIRMETLGRVVVELEVPNDMPPHADATAAVSALDFLGSMKVDYSPGTAAVMLNPDQMVRGSSGGGIQDAIPEITNQATEFLASANRVLNEEMALGLNATMVSLREALDAFTEAAEGRTLTDAQAALQTLQSAGARLDTLMANPALGSSIDRIGELTLTFQGMANDLTGATTALAEILDTVQNGNGTIGMALRDSTLHNDMHDVLISMRLLLDDIRERPGRYFRIKIF